MAFDFSEASDIIDNNSDELNNINEYRKDAYDIFDSLFNRPLINKERFISIVKFLHSLKSYISLKRNKGLYEKIIIFGSNLKIYYNYIVCKLIKSINFMNKSNFNFQRVNNKPHISWR